MNMRRLKETKDLVLMNCCFVKADSHLVMYGIGGIYGQIDFMVRREGRLQCSKL